MSYDSGPSSAPGAARAVLGYENDSVTTHAAYRVSYVPSGLPTGEVTQSYTSPRPTAADLRTLAGTLLAGTSYAVSSTEVSGHQFQGYQWISPTVVPPFTPLMILVKNSDGSPLYRTLTAIHPTTGATQKIYAKFWVACQPV
jgi:hypothetical protein